MEGKEHLEASEEVRDDPSLKEEEKEEYEMETGT